MDAVSAFMNELSASTELSDPAGFEKLIEKVHVESGFPHGKLNQPIRLAVTGKNSGADLYTTLSLIGRDRVVSRLEKFINSIKKVI